MPTSSFSSPLQPGVQLPPRSQVSATLNGYEASFAFPSQSQHSRLRSIRPSLQPSVHSPTVQWAPLQLKGCTREYIITLTHYAIGGVAAHRACPRRCSRHYSNRGCKELWLPPSPLPGCPVLPRLVWPHVLSLWWRWYRSAAPAGVHPRTPSPSRSSSSTTLRRPLQRSCLAGGFQWEVTLLFDVPTAVCCVSVFLISGLSV